jgi:hypothetical protein
MLLSPPLPASLLQQRTARARRALCSSHSSTLASGLARTWIQRTHFNDCPTVTRVAKNHWLTQNRRCAACQYLTFHHAPCPRRAYVASVRLLSDPTTYPAYILSYTLTQIANGATLASYSFSTAGARSPAAPYYSWVLPPYQPQLPTSSSACLWKIVPASGSQGRYLHLLDVELYYTDASSVVRKLGTTALTYAASSTWQGSALYAASNAFDGDVNTAAITGWRAEEAAQQQSGGPWLYAAHSCRSALASCLGPAMHCCRCRLVLCLGVAACCTLMQVGMYECHALALLRLPGDWLSDV